MVRVIVIGLLVTAVGAQPSNPPRLDPLAIGAFTSSMVERHGFERARLASLFEEARLLTSVLAAVSRPAEAKPWYRYRPIFVTPERAQAGAQFSTRHRHTFDAVATRYGVPAEVVAAIIGIETYYGKNTGSYRVVDALATLAFHFPKRASFFRSELEAYLLMTREGGIDPLSLRGSYAGAMGIPQFIPSSYRRFAVDFDADGRADIWSNPADAIASVANYLREHGWERGEPVAVRARVVGRSYEPYLYQGSVPEAGLLELERSGVLPVIPLRGDATAAVVALDTERGTEFWLGMRNFYTITRYNNSALYAMAVSQLAEAIRNRTGDAGGSKFDTFVVH